MLLSNPNAIHNYPFVLHHHKFVKMTVISSSPAMQRLMVFSTQKWKTIAMGQTKLKTWGATDFSWFLVFTIQFLGYPILTHTPRYARANIKTTSSQVHFKTLLHPCRRQLHPLYHVFPALMRQRGSRPRKIG